MSTYMDTQANEFRCELNGIPKGVKGTCTTLLVTRMNALNEIVIRATKAKVMFECRVGHCNDPAE